MELEELKNIWKNHDEQLNTNVQVNQKLLKTVSLDKVDSLLSEFKLSNILELIINGLVSMWFIGFIVENLSAGWIFVLSAAILLAGLVFDLHRNISNLIGLHDLKFKNNVIEAQKQMELFRIRERRDIHLLYIAIPLFSPLFLIVFFKGVLGIDIYPYFWTWYGASYLLGSVVIAVIVIYFLKKFPDKKMVEAARFLSEIKEFED